jgi:cytochrome c
MNRFGIRVLLSLAMAMPALPARADLALAKSQNCMSCHNIEKKIVGPSYKDIAAKYKGDTTAPARLANKIMAGGGGVWGVVKMPSNPQVSDADAKKLAHWILVQ